MLRAKSKRVGSVVVRARLGHLSFQITDSDMSLACDFSRIWGVPNVQPTILPAPVPLQLTTSLVTSQGVFLCRLIA